MDPADVDSNSGDNQEFTLADSPASVSGLLDKSSSGDVDDTMSLKLVISPTTGGQFDVNVMKTDTMLDVKRTICKRLKVPKERICLLYRLNKLNDWSTVESNELIEGSTLTLVPNVSSGLVGQKYENGVMQALENLTDKQVSDFLSGRTPLNLTMRLGNHMMLIQLQLSNLASKRPAPTAAGSAPTVPTKKWSDYQPAPVRLPDDSPVLTPASSGSPILSGNNEEEPVSNQASSSVPSTSKAQTCGACFSCRASRALGTRAGECGLFPSPVISLKEATKTASTVPLTSPPPIADPDSRTSDESHSETSAERPTGALDAAALAEASKSLSNTLKKFSSEIAKPKFIQTFEKCNVRQKPGAIIETMRHHGRGVYSGTFSGTLNPLLQDRNGCPKKDLSTIVYILNDLISASPYRKLFNMTEEGGASSSDKPQQQPHQPQAQQQETPVEFVSVDSHENTVTKSKMECLKTLMEQKRKKRKAKRTMPCKDTTDEQPSPTRWDCATQTDNQIDRESDDANMEAETVCTNPVIA